jgi:GMP synthase-like glutamine amidotransferase
MSRVAYCSSQLAGWADGSLTGHDSFADTPWINTLVEYVTMVLTETDVRVIGVCFGHQIVGRALKAGVGRNPDGWEAAVNDVQLTEKGKEVFGTDKIVSQPSPVIL